MTDTELNARIAKAKGWTPHEHNHFCYSDAEIRLAPCRWKWDEPMGSAKVARWLPNFVNSPDWLWGMLCEVWDGARIWYPTRGEAAAPIREQVVNAWLAMMEEKA